MGKEARKLLKELEGWLKKDFPRDVLMPVLPGTKRPASAHKNGAWDWTNWDSLQSSRNNRKTDKYNSSNDICVLLRDLCVIDIDTRELTSEFEERFPILKVVPCEITAKGKHYWFVRPSWADTEGYWDGAAQKEKHVDFKSIYKNGTSGIVVVAPSEGKTWERKPWAPDAGLFEIPADLMAAVAKPEAVLASVVIRCVDGNGRVERNACKWVPAMAYFQPFMADADADADAEDQALNTEDGGGIPVPALVDSATLRELFYVLDHGRLSGQHPKGVTRAALGEVRRVADFLGLSDRDANRALVTSITLVAQLDLADVCPTWSLSSLSSLSSLHDENETDTLVIPVDQRLSERLRYEPLENKETGKDKWLFAGRLYASHALVEGDPVLAADPQTAMEVRIVEEGAGFILDVMRRHAGRVVLAGGGALWGVAAEGLLTTPSKHDYDLFVVADSDAEATEIALDICESVPLSRRCQTSRAITLFCENNLMVQVILRRYTRIQDVTRCFDFGPCKVAAWYDSSSQSVDERLTIRAESDFVECMHHFAFWLDLRSWSYSTISRAIKYYHKGFEIFVPGTRREAFRKCVGDIDGGSDGVRISSSISMKLHTIADLFAIERAVIERRKRMLNYHWSSTNVLVKPMSVLRDQLMGYEDTEKPVKPVTINKLVNDIMHQKATTKQVSNVKGVKKCFVKSSTSMYIIKDTGIFGPIAGEHMHKTQMVSAITRAINDHVQFSRMSEDEVIGYACMCKCASDYSTRVTMAGSLAFVAARIYQATAKAVRTFVRIGIAPWRASASENQNEISWQTADMVMNQRRVVNLPALYDMPALRRVLAEESRFSTGNAEAEADADTLVKAFDGLAVV